MPADSNTITNAPCPRKPATFTSLCLLALLPGSLALAQDFPEPEAPPAQESIVEPPTLQERIIEEREVAEQAAAEVLSEANTGIDAPLDAPGEPQTHATRQAPLELVMLAGREPERFIGKTLVLADGVTLVEVGPVLDLRKRIVDQEPYLVVDATQYFNSPTQYAVSVLDVDRIEGDLVVAPEVAGMHLRGLEYYPEDYIALDVTAPDEVLADKTDATAGEGEGNAEAEEPGVIPIRRF